MIRSTAQHSIPALGDTRCALVYANGNRQDEGTHISVGAHFMKGENDDHLPWPFAGKLMVELLNQLEDDPLLYNYDIPSRYRSQ